MNEIPYRDVVEGAKFLMKLPLDRQLRLIELIIHSVPASVDETIKKIRDELGQVDLDVIREVLAFTLAVVKSLVRKDPGEVIRDLEHMGFTEKSARAIVNKIVSELPSAERDAELLRELDEEALARLMNTWVRFFMGDYENFSEWSADAGLPYHCLLAASRFMESALKSVLTGEFSLKRLAKILVEEYGFEPRKARQLVRTLDEHMEDLSRVMLFKYLKRIIDAVE